MATVIGLDSINCQTNLATDNLLEQMICGCGGRIPLKDQVTPVVIDTMSGTFEVKPSAYIGYGIRSGAVGNTAATDIIPFYVQVENATYPANPGCDGVLIYRVPELYLQAGAAIPSGGSVGQFDFLCGVTECDDIRAAVGNDGFAVIATVELGVVDELDPVSFVCCDTCFLELEDRVDAIEDVLNALNCVTVSLPGGSCFPRVVEFTTTQTCPGYFVVERSDGVSSGVLSDSLSSWIDYNFTTSSVTYTVNRFCSDGTSPCGSLPLPVSGQECFEATCTLCDTLTADTPDMTGSGALTLNEGIYIVDDFSKVGANITVNGSVIILSPNTITNDNNVWSYASGYVGTGVVPNIVVNGTTYNVTPGHGTHGDGGQGAGGPGCLGGNGSIENNNGFGGRGEYFCPLAPIVTYLPCLPGNNASPLKAAGGGGGNGQSLPGYNACGDIGGDGGQGGNLNGFVPTVYLWSCDQYVENNTTWNLRGDDGGDGFNGITMGLIGNANTFGGGGGGGAGGADGGNVFTGSINGNTVIGRNIDNVGGSGGNGGAGGTGRTNTGGFTGAAAPGQNGQSGSIGTELIFNTSC